MEGLPVISAAEPDLVTLLNTGPVAASPGEPQTALKRKVSMLFAHAQKTLFIGGGI